MACAWYHERKSHNHPDVVEMGEAELEMFRDLGPEEFDLQPSPHCDLRQLERSQQGRRIVWKDIWSAVREGGYVIERRVDRASDGAEMVVLLLMFWVSQPGQRQGIPLHTVVQFDPFYANEWVVRTVYDPSLRPDLWDAADGYEIRHR